MMASALRVSFFLGCSSCSGVAPRPFVERGARGGQAAKRFGVASMPHFRKSAMGGLFTLWRSTQSGPDVLDSPGIRQEFVMTNRPARQTRAEAPPREKLT